MSFWRSTFQRLDFAFPISIAVIISLSWSPYRACHVNWPWPKSISFRHSKLPAYFIKDMRAQQFLLVLFALSVVADTNDCIWKRKDGSQVDFSSALKLDTDLIVSKLRPDPTIVSFVWDECMMIFPQKATQTFHINFCPGLKNMDGLSGCFKDATSICRNFDGNQDDHFTLLGTHTSFNNMSFVDRERPSSLIIF